LWIWKELDQGEGYRGRTCCIKASRSVLLEAAEGTQPIACQAAAAGSIIGRSCAGHAGWNIGDGTDRHEGEVGGLESGYQLEA
jgi:hypothetical protein